LKCVEESLGVILRLRLELERDLETVSLDYVELRNFWENRVFLNTEVEVTRMVESLGRDTTEVSNTRKDYRDKLFEESVHSFSTERNGHTYWHSFTELEVRDGLSGKVYLWSLSGDQREIVLERREILVSACYVSTDTHVEYNLLKSRKLHNVLNLERLLKFWKNFRINVVLE